MLFESFEVSYFYSVIWLNHIFTFGTALIRSSNWILVNRFLISTYTFPSRRFHTLCDSLLLLRLNYLSLLKHKLLEVGVFRHYKVEFALIVKCKLLEHFLLLYLKLTDLVAGLFTDFLNCFFVFMSAELQHPLKIDWMQLVFGIALLLLVVYCWRYICILSQTVG